MSSSEIPPPISIPTPLPVWRPGNLADHVNKRVAVDTGCLESLDGLDHQLLIGDLRRISEHAYLVPSLIYECESVDDGGRFRERRAHFVDGRLVMAITDRDQTTFITCFHLHKNTGGSCPGKPQNEADSARRLLAEKQRLSTAPSTRIRNLKFLES
jgi:hypothetical protein